MLFYDGPATITREDGGVMHGWAKMRKYNDTWGGTFQRMQPFEVRLLLPYPFQLDLPIADITCQARAASMSYKGRRGTPVNSVEVEGIGPVPKWST